MPDESLRHTLPGGELPDPIEIFQDSWKEFADDPGPYLLAGVGQMLITFPVVMMLIMLIYFGLFGTIIGGLVVGAIAGGIATSMAGEEVGGIVFGVVYVLSWVLAMVVVMAISAVAGAAMAPLQASMVRRIAKHQRGEQTLDFTAAFTDVKENVFGVVVVALLISTIVITGLFFCYLPGIVAAFLLIYATSLVYLHGQSPVVAFKESFNHFRENLQFHGMFTLLYFGCAMVSAYIPIAGPMFLASVHVRAHRTLFGDGADPVLQPKLLTEIEPQAA